MAKASWPRDRRGGARTLRERGEASAPRPVSGAGAPRPAVAVDAHAIAEAALELPLPLSDEQARRLAGFAALLAKWNRVHNLTARESPDDLLYLHLLDSLSLVPPLRHALAPRGRAAALRVLDVGSGGGLPGIPLAIAEPQMHVTLLDKVAKKVAFLQQAKAELRLANVECVAARIEDFRPQQLFDVVTSRAYASLRDFVDGSRHLLAEHGLWAAMKGARPDDELADLPPTVAVRDIVKLRVPRLDAERHLVFLQTRTRS